MVIVWLMVGVMVFLIVFVGTLLYHDHKKRPNR